MVVWWSAAKSVGHGYRKWFHTKCGTGLVTGRGGWMLAAEGCFVAGTGQETIPHTKWHFESNYVKASFMKRFVAAMDSVHADQAVIGPLASTRLVVLSLRMAKASDVSMASGSSRGLHEKTSTAAKRCSGQVWMAT